MFFTIGHSTHMLDYFVKLLKDNQINALADVRSSPYSRFQAHFNREALAKSLFDVGIAYVFLGEELGGRSQDSQDYDNNRVVYSRMRRKPAFDRGLDRLVSGSEKYKLAIMCTEKDPIECHRALLVSRALAEINMEVTHILGDGTLESHDASMDRLLKHLKMDKPDLFRSEGEILDEALLLQESKVAFVIGSQQSGQIGISGFSDDELTSGDL